MESLDFDCELNILFIANSNLSKALFDSSKIDKNSLPYKKILFWPEFKKNLNVNIYFQDFTSKFSNLNNLHPYKTIILVLHENSEDLKLCKEFIKTFYSNFFLKFLFSYKNRKEKSKNYFFVFPKLTPEAFSKLTDINTFLQEFLNLLTFFQKFLFANFIVIAAERNEISFEKIEIIAKFLKENIEIKEILQKNLIDLQTKTNKNVEITDLGLFFLSKKANEFKLLEKIAEINSIFFPNLVNPNNIEYYKNIDFGEGKERKNNIIVKFNENFKENIKICFDCKLSKNDNFTYFLEISFNISIENIEESEKIIDFLEKIAENINKKEKILSFSIENNELKLKLFFIDFTVFYTFMVKIIKKNIPNWRDEEKFLKRIKILNCGPIFFGYSGGWTAKFISEFDINSILSEEFPNKKIFEDIYKIFFEYKEELVVFEEIYNFWCKIIKESELQQFLETICNRNIKQKEISLSNIEEAKVFFKDLTGIDEKNIEEAIEIIKKNFLFKNDFFFKNLQKKIKGKIIAKMPDYNLEISVEKK